jgi:hypothetical protein
MKWSWGIIATIFIFIVAGTAAAYFYTPSVPEPIVYEPNGDPPLFDSPVVDGLKIYRSYLLGFQITYPEELQVKEYGKANTSTITFEDERGQKGFQIFVVPYEEETISEKRFKMDIPSGVMKDPIDVVIDGVTARAFFSTNSVFGETREVWFIKNGFLYEVTTRKDLDPWLAEIMNSWKFL